MSVKNRPTIMLVDKLIRYYDSVSIVISAANIRWVAMNNF